MKRKLLALLLGGLVALATVGTTFAGGNNTNNPGREGNTPTSQPPGHRGNTTT
jgi:hypothetical protein